MEKARGNYLLIPGYQQGEVHFFAREKQIRCFQFLPDLVIMYASSQERYWQTSD